MRSKSFVRCVHAAGDHFARKTFKLMDLEMKGIIIFLTREWLYIGNELQFG